MGLVFRAWDTQLHRVVAVKTLSMSLWTLPAARERFIREGRAAAMLNHPNIVPMYDVITIHPFRLWSCNTSLGQHWMNGLTHMARCPVAGLAHRLAVCGCPVRRACRGTRTSRHQTWQRPVRSRWHASLADRLWIGTSHGRCYADTEWIIGGHSALYVTEQAKGEDTDGRSDLFSLGSLIYFAISAQTPFRGRESMSVLNSLCHSSQVPLHRLRNDVPTEVSKLVDRLLQKQPASRPASGQQVRDELRKLLAAEQRLINRPVRQKQRSRWLSAGACALVVLLLLLTPRMLASVGAIRLLTTGSLSDSSGFRASQSPSLSVGQ